jgi:short-subunit dehydrogenase involved in D-alanine esterification of teichoic acids
MDKSKIVLITGGNKGIGLETARQLGKMGYENSIIISTYFTRSVSDDIGMAIRKCMFESNTIIEKYKVANLATLYFF